MGSINDEIGRLKEAKILIKSAIEECGVSVPEIDPKTNENMKINKYAEYISFIPSAVLSNLNVGPIGDDNHFIKIIEQTNGLINVTLGGTVSTSSSGLVPKIDISDLDSITSIQLNDLILTTTSDYAPIWKKFLIPIYTGATSTSNGIVGLVPSCPSNRYNAFLRGDGTWTSPSDTKVTNNTTTSKYYLTGSTSNANTTGTLVKRSTIYVDTDGHLYDNSIKVATEDYVNNKILDGFAINDAMVFKGTLGTGGTVTSLPTNGYSAGWTYKVATAGTYAGQVCGVGDMVICVKDGTATGTSVINGDWSVVQNNIDKLLTLTFDNSGDGADSGTTYDGFTAARIISYNTIGAAPTSHASTDTTYGLGTLSNYGHVKISNGDVNSIAHANGLVAGMNHTHSNYSSSTHNHDSIYKKIQDAVASPSASSSTNSFIDTISQDAQGVIKATKKTLSAASSLTIGGIKIGKDNSSYTVATNTSPTITANVTTAGKYYAVEIDKNDKAYVYVPWTDTTYNVATQSANGLMSANDKKKLDGIPTINSGTANKLAYYSGATTISSYTTTKGSTTKGIYLNAGVPTQMTYSLSATVNSGTSSRLAYYSGANAISSYSIPNSVGNLTTVYVLGSYSSAVYYSPNVTVKNGTTLYASGGFYESSDNKLKNFKENIEINFEKLKQLPKKYFTWKSDETNKLNIGTSAQELQKLYPELVSEDENGLLHVAYDKLSIIALSAIDKLYEEVCELKSIINSLQNK